MSGHVPPFKYCQDRLISGHGHLRYFFFFRAAYVIGIRDIRHVRGAGWTSALDRRSGRRCRQPCLAEHTQEGLKNIVARAYADLEV